MLAVDKQDRTSLGQRLQSQDWTWLSVLNQGLRGTCQTSEP